MNKRKIILIVSIVILLVFIGITIYFENDKPQHVPYANFYSYVESCFAG
jgi:membrane-bound acyltransferase YfiQ involved in biofilm formation